MLSSSCQVSHFNNAYTRDTDLHALLYRKYNQLPSYSHSAQHF